MGMRVFKYLLDSIIKIQWACCLIVTIQYLYSVVCKTIIHLEFVLVCNDTGYRMDLSALFKCHFLNLDIVCFTQAFWDEFKFKIRFS